MPPIPYKVPAWVDPNNASVTDSWFTWAARQVGRLVGADDPAGSVMGLAGAMDVPAQKAAGAVKQAIKAYHGSRSGAVPAIEAGRPFYTTVDRGMAEGYGLEAVNTGRGSAPLITEYHLDPTDYISRDEYQDILNRHLPNDSWIGDYPSEAATVNAPGILSELKRRGIKGVRDLWDFGMDARTERQVNVTLDPSTIRRPSIKAFHGSPHDFEQFSLKHIGTGEGAQAYGHGLYFAENEHVAKEYRDQLGKVVPSFGGNPTTTAAESMAHDILSRIPRGSDPQATLQRAISTVDEWADAGIFRGKNEGQAALEVKRAISENFDKELGSAVQGKMYEVNIHADPESFLDWDKPLKEQPANVKQVANDFFRGRLKTREIGPDLVDVHEQGGGSLGVFPKSKVPDVLANPADFYPYKGEQLYREISSETWPSGAPKFSSKKDAAKASETLKKAGVPGIRYLDQGSRAAGEGSRNYAVFDDTLISVARKYGIPLAVLSSPTGKKMLESLARRDQLAETPAQGQNRRTP